MIKTGEQHIASLRDGREIYLDGERVTDATVHPAYRGAVASIGRMFDFQSAPENRELMTFETETGTRANRIWQLPASYDELVTRRKGLEAWTELPIWLPPTGEAAGLHDGDVSAAYAAGLTCRPIEETIADTWQWLQAEGYPEARPGTGLDPDSERRVLDSLPG